jgi:hypothetical protein
MSIKTDVIAALAGSPQIAVYPGAAPQDTPKPFVVYKTAASTPINTIHGTCPITGSEFVFECWGSTAAQAANLAETVRNMIDASALVKERIPAPEDGYDPEVDEYVEPVAYRFWHQ